MDHWVDPASFLQPDLRRWLYALRLDGWHPPHPPFVLPPFGAVPLLISEPSLLYLLRRCST
jgi:hypothetical protein